MKQLHRIFLPLSLAVTPWLAGQAATVTRGPYLQLGSPTAITVKWRTDTSTDSVVRYGTTAGNLTATASGATTGAGHEVRLAGLTPNTKYFYSVGSSSATLAGDNTYYFITAPTNAKPTRIWAIGDAGTADRDQEAVRDAYYGFTGARETDLWLMLGDNAYSDGTEEDYQAAVFDIYPTLLRKSVVWPTLGNHDGHSATSSSQSGPYYSIFTLPRNGEAGGLPSGTEAYYSYDYGNIHFICLNSYDVNRSANGAMANWLKLDLAATTKDWIIAYWHHPPYSKGSHDSDEDTELIEMRQNIVPILEAGGVDLVLGGHSHCYERSYLLNGHYGMSSTFTSSMQIDAGSGREGGSGAYTKPGDNAANQGAVYIVAGSAGKLSGGSLDHPAMYISMSQLGSVVVDIDGERMDVKFVRSTGAVADYFTIKKGFGTPSVPPAPTGLSAMAGDGEVTLNWTAANSATGYYVKRATSSGGPFSTVGTATATSYRDTGLVNGATYYFVVSAVNSVGEGANSAVTSATPGQMIILEAENATLSGVMATNNHPGFNGTGYGRYMNNSGAYIEWKVNTAAGTQPLEFRYANGGTIRRPLEVKVNGAVVNSALNFPFTASWSDWATVSQTATVNAGTNTIRLTDLGTGGPNVDYLRLTTASPVPRISSVTRSGSNVLISFTSVAGRLYRVERKDSLADSSWTTVVDNVPGTGAIVTVTNVGGANQPSRFYRVRNL